MDKKAWILAGSELFAPARTPTGGDLSLPVRVSPGRDWFTQVRTAPGNDLLTPTQIEKITDRELYALCKKCGAVALEARRRFAGLLPEVSRREMVALAKGRSWLGKRGYSGIYEFAARLAGMGRDQVNRVLRLERKFEHLPVLHEVLVNGWVSVNKLARIAAIATEDNQLELLEKARVLSKGALEVYVRDTKNCVVSNGLVERSEAVPGHEKGMGQSALGDVKLGGRGARAGGGGGAQELELMRVLSPVVKQKMLVLIRQGHDLNEILMKLLVAREAELERKMEAAGGQRARARYVPVEIRKMVGEKYGRRCAVVGCGKSAEHLHHLRGFAVTKSHDPRWLRPLCRVHHELAHGGWGAWRARRE